MVEAFRNEFATNANQSKAKSVIKQIKKLDKRLYKPRVVEDIFEGMQKRKTDKEEYRRMQYEVETVEEADAQEKFEQAIYEEGEVMDYIRKETALDNKKHDWLAFAKQQSEFYDNVKQYMINLQIDMQDIDTQIEDVLVMVEDANLNAPQGYKVFKQLKELRNKKKEIQKEYNCLVALTKGMTIGEVVDQAYYAVRDIEDIMGVNSEVETVESVEEFEEVDEGEILEIMNINEAV